MQRRMGQGNLVEGLTGTTVGRNATLDRIAAMIDWPALEAVLDGVYASPTGRPAYPVGVLLRALLLQAWHGLSDPAAELALADRLSFRRFLGVGLDEPTPDHSTLWRFREHLARLGLDARLFAELNRQLDGHGVILRTGSLVDATLIEANVSAKNTRADGRPVDPDARWTRRGKRSVLGYKMHVAVDEGSGLVRGMAVTDAATHDVRQGPGLVQGDEAMVTADKAYDSAAMRAAVARAGAAGGCCGLGDAQRAGPAAAQAMAALDEPCGVAGAGRRGAGVRHVEAQPPRAPGAAVERGPQHGGPDDAGDGLQPAPGGSDAGGQTVRDLTGEVRPNGGLADRQGPGRGSADPFDRLNRPGIAAAHASTVTRRSAIVYTLMEAAEWNFRYEMQKRALPKSLPPRHVVSGLWSRRTASHYRAGAGPPG